MEDVKINVKIKLSALWATAVFCYAYADIFGFYKPGHIDEIRAGETPLGSQVSLLGFGTLMVIPCVMVFLSLALPAKVNRWANIILGIVYTGVILISMLLPGVWAYYFLFGTVEVVLTALIAWYAYKWK